MISGRVQQQNKNRSIRPRAADLFQEKRNNKTKLYRGKMTPNSSVFGHCAVFCLIRLNAFRLRRHSSIRRGPRTEHVWGLLQRNSIPDSLCWRVLHCVFNQPVHIWLPKSVARKNNHGLTRNPREPSDWQAVEGKKPLGSPRGGTAGGTAGGTPAPGTDLLGRKSIGSPRRGTAGGTAGGTPAPGTNLLLEGAVQDKQVISRI